MQDLLSELASFYIDILANSTMIVTTSVLSSASEVLYNHIHEKLNCYVGVIVASDSRSSPKLKDLQVSLFKLQGF